MDTLKKNIFFKGLLTFSNYIIGFVTFPYITRILGPDNFGLVNFALNTIDYFLLFATMGIVSIGTREVASANNNRKELDIVYSRVLGTNLIFTLVCILILICCIQLVPKFYTNRELLYIGSVKILFTAFTIEWLFTGLENFKFITIRSLLVRIGYVIAVFLFVNDREDYVLYFNMTIGVVVINALINFIYSRKFVTISLKDLLSNKYVKQNIRLGIYVIMTSMYITFNVMFLGLVSTDKEVGYYSTAVKLYFIAVSLFSAFTSVMLPRISTLKVSNQNQQVDKYIQKSFYIVFLTAIPIIVLSIVYTPEIIKLMSGSGYADSIKPMRILMPALLLVWISQVIVFQCLLPGKHDKSLLIASIIGGSIAIILNIIITPSLKAVGSALTLLISEVIVTAYYMVVVFHSHLIKFLSCKEIGKLCAISLPYIIICLIIPKIFSGFLSFGVALCLFLLYFLSIKPLNLIREIK